MKKIILITLTVLFFAVNVQAEVYRLDTAQSKIEWIGKKLTEKHHGTIQVKSGTLNVDGMKITGGEFEIDMNTIKVLNIQNPKSNAKLTNHLKSDDFFSAEKFPTSKFMITRVEQKKGNIVEVTGNLTIKGITHIVTIPTTLKKNGDTLQATGSVKLDRTRWDIKYGSGKFFKGLGDKLIRDDFELKLNLVASKS